ncbi:Formyl transferase [Seinonella peptonophila]|uniref:Formyl transferase n=1 Tax=Seinonella peptonophila TaxID=112248 RepID=A0A1M4ZZM9_9BACL|nr:formyltransferase family protein [Seinonella peptonophila]SHF23431.1 Formyl transferase [Seinonella peptonophila]
MSLKVYVYDPDHVVSQVCLWYFQKRKLPIVDTPEKADVAFAPNEKIKKQKKRPKYGTLIFHPSLLPRHRGEDALRWAFRFGEKYTGATWYWLDDMPYTGDICEMVVLGIGYGENPKDFYTRAVVPAAMNMLFFIVNDLSKGLIRRRPQSNESATYEPSLWNENE